MPKKLKFDFLPDRFPKAVLKERHRQAYDCLERKGILEGKDLLLRFTGIASAGHDKCTVFLPHGLSTESPEHASTYARATMSAISKFAHDNKRAGESGGPDESLTFVAIMAELAQDYRDHGIFSERLRRDGYNSGKPDWRATLRMEMPMLAENGVPVFSGLRTIIPFTSSANVLATIQAAVIAEIYERHGWWLERQFGTRPPPRLVTPPPWPRETWGGILARFRQNLFAERPLILTRLLEQYLVELPKSGTGDFVCGISDFSTLWEAMLRHSISGVESGWNGRLPVARYLRGDGTHEAGGYMEMDMVIRSENTLTIADAKYYTARSAKSAPGWPDIVKQIYYAEAMRTVVDESISIRNCFIFPVAPNECGSFSGLSMFHRDGKAEERFPHMDCYYLDTFAVISAYCDGSKIRLN